jgi:GNAT superfamily N-acetyltransferase
MRNFDYHVRPYRDEDEERVLRLLERSLGAGPIGKRSPEFFRWKHVENPFGRSLMIVAESAGDIIGLRAFMRWEFRANERNYRAVRAVDTATDPRFQGRGIFSRLTLKAIEQLTGDTDFIFNTPNEKSKPGYLKMGWTEVGQVPIYARIARPISLARHFFFGPGGIESQTGDASAVLTRWSEPPWITDGRLATVKSRAFLEWRYGRAPGLHYRAVLRDRHIALFRLRVRGRLVEAMLADVISDSVDAARSLLREVRGEARADYVTAHFARSTVQRTALRREVFLPSPLGPTLVVRSLGRKVKPDSAHLSSWALSLGDLEVF